ncbi:hypothetical protein [Paenibacillus macerans]|nr:hypothetical protein [Paenibacillus macerans]
MTLNQFSERTHQLDALNELINVFASFRRWDFCFLLAADSPTRQ